MIRRAVKSHLKKIYAATVPYNFKLGATFRTVSAFLRSSECWDVHQIGAYQSEKLQELLNHAYTNVPAYRDKYDRYGININSIRSPKDLHNLPLLSKLDLRSSPSEAFLATNIDSNRLQQVMSGGTTGDPTVFYHVKGFSDAVFNAFRLMTWRPSGYSPNKRALDLTWAFSGEKLRFNPYMNWLSYSITALDPLSFSSVVDKIEAFRPRFIIGYPSTVSMFSELLREHGVQHLQIDGVITGSEMMYVAQREQISKTFGCRIWEWYGLSELAGFASFCEHADQYHFLPQAGCVELVDENGNLVTHEGDEGEIVLTGFYTHATPFIRYQTGDRGILGGKSCSSCGRNYTIVKKIVGREQDFLVSKNGSLVPLSAVNCHSEIFKDVWKYQIHQNKAGFLILKIMPKPSYSDESVKIINSLLQHTLGNEFSWVIENVEDIPGTSRGKHKFLVQEMKLGLF